MTICIANVQDLIIAAQSYARRGVLARTAAALKGQGLGPLVASMSARLNDAMRITDLTARDERLRELAIVLAEAREINPAAAARIETELKAVNFEGWAALPLMGRSAAQKGVSGSQVERDFFRAGDDQASTLVGPTQTKTQTQAPSLTGIIQPEDLNRK